MWWTWTDHRERGVWHFVMSKFSLGEKDWHGEILIRSEYVFKNVHGRCVSLVNHKVS